LFITAGILCVYCCKSKEYIPSKPELEIASSHWPDVTVQSLKEGYRLYTVNCVRCHELYKPLEYSESDWIEIIPGMARKAHLDSKQEEKICCYILSKREAESRQASKNK
jgi:hypothetical protein